MKHLRSIFPWILWLLWVLRASLASLSPPAE